MGLILTLRKDEDFYVGERRFVVEEVFDNRNCLVVDPETGERFEITDDRSTEIAAEIMACTAVAAESVNLSINAPQEVTILRGELKRGGKKR